MRPASHEASPSVSGLVSWPTTALATVISSPSRIQATPSAITMRVWNGDQGSRSIRAGMRLRIAPDVGASWVVVIERLRVGSPVVGRRRSFPFHNDVNRVHPLRWDLGHAASFATGLG